MSWKLFKNFDFHILILSKTHLCCFMRKANHSAHKSLGLYFVQLLQYPDDYGQSRQVVENTSKCSIDNTNKFCTEVGEFINENHSRRPQVIGERPRSKYQTLDFFRLCRIVIRTIMVSEILHKVALKESCITLLSHRISFNLRVLSYDTAGPCNYRVEQLTARFLMSQFVAWVCRMSLSRVASFYKIGYRTLSDISVWFFAHGRWNSRQIISH